MSSLNHEVGGDVSGNLGRVYIYICGISWSRQICTDRADIVEGVLSLLRELRESWAEVDRLAGSGQSTGENTEMPRITSIRRTTCLNRFTSELETNLDLRPLLRMRRLAQEIREGLGTRRHGDRGAGCVCVTGSRARRVERTPRSYERNAAQRGSAASRRTPNPCSTSANRP